jgi:hypothetical protein
MEIGFNHSPYSFRFAVKRLPTAAGLYRDACASKREKVTATSDAVSPSKNCAIKFQQFMVSLRIIQRASMASEERN